MAGPASAEGAEIHEKVIELVGLLPAQAPLPVTVMVSVTLPVGEVGVKVGVKVLPPAVMEPVPVSPEVAQETPE